MRTDSLFYLIFQTSPGIIFELIGDPNPRASTYSFASQEVKQTSFRIDGTEDKGGRTPPANLLILVPPIYATDLPILFVEIQGYKDRNNVLHSSFFSQVFLYLHTYQPKNDWRGILIFSKRSLDTGLPIQYQDFAKSQRFQRIYLDELSSTNDLSIGLSLLHLIGLKEDVAPQQAKQLIQRAAQEATNVLSQRKIIELVETIFVYKFPELGRQEIEAMLGLEELKQTKVYQEALEEGRQEGRLEGKLAAVPLLLQAGISVEQIAQQLDLDINTVRLVASNSSQG